MANLLKFFAFRNRFSTRCLSLYKNQSVFSWIYSVGFIPVVPPKKNRKEPWEYDKKLYKRRNEVERFFLRLKRFRKVCTRYDKLDVVFLSVIMLAMIFDAVFM